MKKNLLILFLLLVAIGLYGFIFINQHAPIATEVQMARDIAQRLEESGAILDQIPDERIDIETSSKEFVIIYDTEGGAIAGNGYLNGKLLAVPKGVFDAAFAAGELNRSLAPQPGLRIASFIKPFVGREANGFVLVGKNVR